MFNAKNLIQPGCMHKKVQLSKCINRLKKKWEMCEKPFVLDGHCVCVCACVTAVERDLPAQR